MYLYLNKETFPEQEEESGWSLRRDAHSIYVASGPESVFFVYPQPALSRSTQAGLVSNHPGTTPFAEGSVTE